jgi:hypothetical protein
MIRLQFGRVKQTWSPILIAEVSPISEVSYPPSPYFHHHPFLFPLQGREGAMLQIAMGIRARGDDGAGMGIGDY